MLPCRSVLLAETKDDDQDEIHVAILDTAPSEAELDDAYGRWHEEHPLIRSLLGPNDQFEVPNAHFEIIKMPAKHSERLNPPGTYYDLKGHHYMMQDHGLFVAGIIHSIAPRAKIHLIQVLNDYGVGDQHTIGWGLRQMRGLAENDRKLIVNLSLTLAIPLDEKHLRMSTNGGKPEVKQPSSLECQITRISCDALRGPDNADNAGNTVIVAAAGNDGIVEDGNQKPRTRAPAIYEHVIGVGAYGEAYSNAADEPAEEGILTFGGSAQNGITNSQTSILGIYIGDLPTNSSGQSSHNGWARWAGTSFATPIVSGAIARLAAKKKCSPQEAVDSIRDIIRKNENVLEVTQGHQTT